LTGFAILKEDVGVLRRTAEHGMVRRESAGPRRVHEPLIDHRADGLDVEGLDLLQLVRCAEAVEEVQEGHARLERRGVGDEREILRLLDRRRGEQREAGAADRHHVAVVAENRERMRGDRPRRHVERPPASARRQS
jgi:hypothetical protein